MRLLTHIIRNDMISLLNSQYRIIDIAQKEKTTRFAEWPLSPILTYRRTETMIQRKRTVAQHLSIALRRSSRRIAAPEAAHIVHVLSVAESTQNAYTRHAISLALYQL